MKKGLKYLIVLVSGVVLLVMSGCTQVDDLKKANAELGMEVENLKSKNMYLTQENENILNENKNLRGMLAQKQSALSDTESQLNTLRSKLSGTGAEAIMSEGRPAVMLEQQITFASGKAQLTNDGKKVLKKVADILKSDFAGSSIKIAGHTDTDPIKKTKDLYKSNWELSVARALAVLHYFQNECGLDPKRLQVAGFSQYQPISSSKAKNRRVEIIIFPTGTD